MRRSAIRSGRWGLTLLAITIAAARAAAQDAGSRNELILAVEPLAVSGRYAVAVAPAWRLGPSLSVGPFEGVTVRRGQSGELREWATAYATVSVAPAPAFEVVLHPIGAALALGDDFSSVYPTAQLGVQLGGRRWLVGSDLRVIRIAGASGSGHLWVQWIPVRVGVRWRW